MICIDVAASGFYQVKIGKNLLPTLGQEVTNVCKAKTAVVVSDSNVFPLYGHIAMESLKSAGMEVLSFVFPAGEESKNSDTYLELLNYLAQNHVTRTDVLVALGGGVVGDLTGFAAATYLRGIAYIQVPTTLLAAVDSSVGGKTAIDLPTGKNLVGAFCQPRLVLCDINTLHTLTKEIFLDGCAEVIKYGILYDPDLFEHLKTHKENFHREQVIARCVELKRNVVQEDEFDTGARMKLNLGHTIGHGIEAESGFAVSHGKAVAIGMCIAARAAKEKGYCDADTEAQIVQTVASFGLPTTTQYDVEALYIGALSDKKRSAQLVNLIVPRAIGQCDIVPMNLSEVKSFIGAGLFYGY